MEHDAEWIRKRRKELEKEDSKFNYEIFKKAEKRIHESEEAEDDEVAISIILEEARKSDVENQESQRQWQKEMHNLVKMAVRCKELSDEERKEYRKLLWLRRINIWSRFIFGGLDTIFFSRYHSN